MSSEVAAAMDERTAVFGCKRTKLAEAGLRDSSVKSSAPPKVVHIFYDPRTAVTDVPPPRRQYLTRSRVAASTNLSHQGKPDGVGCYPTKSSSTTDSKHQGNTDFATSFSL